MAMVARHSALQPRFRSFARGFEYPSEIEDFLREYMAYTPEHVETVLAPDDALGMIHVTGIFAGDCDDAATFAAAVAYAIGVQSKFIAIRLPGQSSFSHVYTNIEDVIVDPTVEPGTDYQFAEAIELKV